MRVRCLLLILLFATPVSAEVLRVGTSGDYSPFSKDGRGFDIDVAGLLARDLGVRIEWVPFRWPELSARVAAGDFDVVMSGVTWRPERSVIGWMSRAVAKGGPCVIGSSRPATVAVNRGGILERWARARFEGSEIRAVDDNASLPRLLTSGTVEAIVTDSFEVRHFARPGQAIECAAARDRKVYWVSPERAEQLGPRIDAWLARNEASLDELRRQWFGSAQPRDAVDHVVDLAARRLALMPAVAAYKRAHGLPIEDLERERLVLDAAEGLARRAGLDPEALRSSFRLQVDLAKGVQRGAPPLPATLDLKKQIRPALIRLGARLVEAYALASPIEPGDLPLSKLDPAAVCLDRRGLEQLREALLLATRRAQKLPESPVLAPEPPKAPD